MKNRWQVMLFLKYALEDNFLKKNFYKYFIL